jgi:short-subunit dehydrogenase
MARVLGERMVARRRGHIVFISSIAGKVSTAQTPLYSATKFGLRGASLGLRKDLARHGVGVTTVFPGFIRDAGMFAETGVKLPAGVGTRSPTQVAEAVLHAVRDNPAEIVVAAAEQRLAAWVAGVSPGLIEVAERLYDTSSIADEVAEKQRGKR